MRQYFTGGLLIIIMLFLLAAQAIVSGQEKILGVKLAVINDPDGYTNIRSGSGKDFPVLTIIRENSVFYVFESAGQWWQVIGPDDMRGYIHRSRVKFVTEKENRRVRFSLDYFSAVVKEIERNSDDQSYAHSIAQNLKNAYDLDPKALAFIFEEISQKGANSPAIRNLAWGFLNHSGDSLFASVVHRLSGVKKDIVLDSLEKSFISSFDFKTFCRDFFPETFAELYP